MSAGEPAWIEEARKHLGVAEIPGVTHHPLILRMWKAIKRGGIQSDEVPWCAAFVGFCLETAVIQSSRFESAKSYLTWGTGLATPFYGCIAVLDGGPSRPGMGHTGFIVGKDQRGRLMVLGGNQGNKVSIAPFDPARAIGLRWPSAVQFPPIGALPTIESAGPSSANEG